MRRCFVAGNWKMNLTLAESRALAARLRDGLADVSAAEIGVCPPFVYLHPVCEVLKNSNIGVGAQNMYHEGSGAFTGEVSGGMLTDIGCKYVILGHSERRHVIGETDEAINAKLKAALASGLTPILCVGEELDDREAGITESVVRTQVTKGLADLTADDLASLVIAYEPVWAIGTGRTATPGQANEVHVFVRGLLGELYSNDFAANVRVQYGGSVKPENAGDLLSQSDIDGALVGGASLKPEPFAAIVQAAL